MILEIKKGMPYRSMPASELARGKKEYKYARFVEVKLTLVNDYVNMGT
jgi:hypothetical protein